MPRPKTMPDEEVLALASRLIHERGPAGVTFEALAEASGLSPSTLVQRFASKAGLIQSTLLHAWDQLDARTASLAAELPQTPEGAVDLLVSLSQSYGDIEAYAEGLLILREDLRNPALRARGTRWRDALTAALGECFAARAEAPADIGMLMAAQWQGALLWWSFDPDGKVERHVERSLRRFMKAVLN